MQAQTQTQALFENRLYNKKELANIHWNKSGSISATIKSDFYNPGTGFMYQGKYKDGSFHNEQSILPAVAMYFNNADDRIADRMLNAYVGPQSRQAFQMEIDRSVSEVAAPRQRHDRPPPSRQ